MEFVAAITRPLGSATPLLLVQDALREAEEMLRQFTILYLDEMLLRIALRGAVAYQLSWFDAHLWAYAEHFGLQNFYRRTSSTTVSTEAFAP